ncbi:hypothetical protein [Paenibacillus sp. FSL H7-0714]|uniref:hypothetical protein n=1 Tax=Paenibacillus sp. FSL H7-0714 TaxID=2954735 RepID=UPI0030F6F583
MKLKAKSILPLALSITMMFAATAGSVSASASDLEPISKSETKQLVTNDGLALGYVIVNKTIEYNNTDEGLEFTVTKDSDYTLNSEFANIEAYSNKFADGVEVNTYLLTENKEIYADGQLLASPSDSPSLSLRIAGGIPAIGHYYTSNDLSTYFFKSYSDIYVDWGLMIRPTGSHLNVGIYESHPKVPFAKAELDSFANNYNDYEKSIKLTLVSLGLTAISWASLVGLIGTGTAAAWAASDAVDAYNDAKSDVQDAFTYISAF